MIIHTYVRTCGKHACKRMYVCVCVCVYVPVLLCTGFDVGLGDILTVQNVTTVTVMVAVTDDIITSTGNITIDSVMLPGGGEFDKFHIALWHSQERATTVIKILKYSCFLKNSTLTAVFITLHAI